MQRKSSMYAVFELIVRQDHAISSTSKLRVMTTDLHCCKVGRCVRAVQGVCAVEAEQARLSRCPPHLVPRRPRRDTSLLMI